MSLICRVVAIAFVAAAVSGCWEGTTRETLASILSLDGSAEISSDDGRTFSPLRLSDTPGKGAIVRTARNARLSLALLPNCLVRLDPDSSVEIGRLALTKDGNETGADMLGRSADIKLSSGRILVSHSWGEALAHFGLATAGGEVTTPSNALFIVRSDGRETRVTCASGWVEFRPTSAAAATRIPPGSVGRWPSSGPNVSKAEDDPVAQEDLHQAIEAEQTLRTLAARKRNILPR